MIYAVKKHSDNSYSITNTKHRKPVLVWCIIVFVYLCFFNPILSMVFLAVVFIGKSTLYGVTNEVLRSYYASAKEPILVYQRSENDKTVHMRCLEVKEMLSKSDNVLYKNGFLKVNECYFREINALETWSNYLLRVENTKNLMLQDMLNGVSHDKEWTKKYMFGQMMNEN